MVKLIFTGDGIYEELKEKIKGIGKYIRVPASGKSYKAIDAHADIQMVNIEGRIYMDADCLNQMIGDKVNSSVKELLIAMRGSILKPMKSSLGPVYPFSVPFNGKSIDRCWIHNLTYTDPDLLRILESLGWEMIHVNQGYTGCSLLAFSGKFHKRCGITSDNGIYKALVNKGFHMLLIEPGYIQLKGMDYGFIGGSCLNIDKAVFFNGDLSTHPNGDQIRRFITDEALGCFEVRHKVLADFGSGFMCEIKGSERNE